MARLNLADDSVVKFLKNKVPGYIFSFFGKMEICSKYVARHPISSYRAYCKSLVFMRATGIRGRRSAQFKGTPSQTLASMARIVK